MQTVLALAYFDDFTHVVAPGLFFRTIPKK